MAYTPVSVSSVDNLVVQENRGIQALNPDQISGNRDFDTDGNYFLAPAIGNGTDGFFITSDAAGYVDSPFDGAGSLIGNDLNGDAVGTTEFLPTGLSSPSVVGENGIVEVAAFNNAGNDLFPGGFAATDPLVDGGLFLGANAGGNPLDNDLPVVVNQALLAFFDGTGAILFGGAFDITGIIQANNQPGGAWDGSAGISVGALAGAGAVQANFVFDVTVIPSPGAAGVLGLAGLAAIRRRR
jgi:hypothetical protein